MFFSIIFLFLNINIYGSFCLCITCFVKENIKFNFYRPFHEDKYHSERNDIERNNFLMFIILNRKSHFPSLSAYMLHFVILSYINVVT